MTSYEQKQKICIYLFKKTLLETIFSGHPSRYLCQKQDSQGGSGH